VFATADHVNALQRGAPVVDSQFFNRLIANCNMCPASGCKRVRMKLSIMCAALVGWIVGGSGAKVRVWAH